MNKDGKLSGNYTIKITKSDESVMTYDIISMPEKGKRPVVSVHGMEKDADEFVRLDDVAKKAIADQGGKKNLLISATKEVRDAAISEGSEVPESVRYATENGRSVMVTAKYPSVKLDAGDGMELKSLLKAKEFESVVNEALTITVPPGTKVTNKLVRELRAALKEVIECQVTRTYKTKSGVDTYQQVEELIDVYGKDSEVLDILRPVHTGMSPVLEVKVSSKQALAKS